MAFRRPSFIQQATLYKFRFILGYGLVLAFLVIILTIDIRILPEGISLKGMNTVVASMHASPSTSLDWVINAPYHLLQQLSVTFFGLERLWIVLPSLVFGVLTMILFLLMMRQWFSESVALITTLIALTSGPFITMVRSATPDIMLPFWTVLLLYAAVKVLVKQERAFVWKVLVVLASIGLVYTPFGLYPLLAFSLAGSLHPHVRSRIRRIKLHRKLILLGILLVGITPLILHCIGNPEALVTLIGLDIFRASLANFPATLQVLYVSFINFMHSGFVGANIAPAFNIASICLMLLGFLRCLKDWHTTRSYALLIWAGISLPVIVLAPYEQQTILMLAMLFLAIGCETLIVEWYKLFPRNPYARIAGLVPLSILFVTIAVTSVTHYFNNHRYLESPTYRPSLAAIRQTLDAEPDKPLLLVTDEPTTAFYGLLQREYDQLSITSIAPKKLEKKTAVTPEVTANLGKPTTILTSALRSNGVVLRIYTP